MAKGTVALTVEYLPCLIPTLIKGGVVFRCIFHASEDLVPACHKIKGSIH